jgi:uncharacterized membrane protein YdbT with pleckstrin-like domain
MLPRTIHVRKEVTMVPEFRGRVPALAARPSLLLLLLALAVGGCDLVEGIFRIGLWVGVIIILLVVLLIWLISRLFR